VLPRLISLLGLVTLLALAFALSNNRRRFPWRTVLWGLGLQFAFALFILKTPLGLALFAGAQRVINQLNLYAVEGATMVFGPLADGDALTGAFGPGRAYIFAVSITATIILVSALSSLLYHWGVLQRVVHGLAWVMRRAMRTSGSESLAAASNIFLGQTEAALLIKPYIAHMTPSEVMALMVTGMATIASGVMAVYAGMGIDGGHLLTASVLSAPAGLIIAKILWPETQPSETGATASANVERASVNSIDALCRGASDGVAMAINILGMLIAFVAIVALANALFGWAQSLFGIAEPVTFQWLLGWVNAPFAWLMGVPARDCLAVGQALGERIVLNEFIGYHSLSQHKAALDPRSYTLATYALCGFANFSSIAIQIGGIGALAPERRGDLARLGLRAMAGGLLACYLTATVVGVLI
jgi:concentrative nucleoside transporter, CNT family